MTSGDVVRLCLKIPLCHAVSYVSIVTRLKPGMGTSLNNMHSYNIFAFLTGAEEAAVPIVSRDLRSDAVRFVREAGS